MRDQLVSSLNRAVVGWRGISHDGETMAENCPSATCGPGFASPAEAMNAPREELLYTVALYVGTGIQRPDYLATIDAAPASPTYSQVIGRLEMPGIGDELHHSGWNACSSCHHDASKARRYLILPGVRSRTCTSSTAPLTRGTRGFTR